MSTPTSKELEHILNAVDKAENACAYADSVKMDVQLITETRYKFRFSEKSSRNGGA